MLNVVIISCNVSDINFALKDRKANFSYKIFWFKLGNIKNDSDLTYVNQKKIFYQEN